MLAWVDRLVRLDTVETLQLANRLAPDDSAVYMRLAQLDEDNARQLLAKALQLDPYNAQAQIELGLRYEADGDPVSAEKALLQAYTVDHTYLTRWSLANFYLRQNNQPAFWMWARKAAEMPAENIGALFQLCWMVSPDPDTISAALLNDDPQIVRQYLSFLVGKGQYHAAAPVALRLIRDGSKTSDSILLLTVVNRLVAANEAPGAIAVWQQLVREKWAVADATVPNNASFARDPLPVSFDWTVPSNAGVYSWTGHSGLQAEFTGKEPENCTVVEQTIALTPGNYMLDYSYRTTDIAPGTGIHWQIVDPRTGNVVATSADMGGNDLQHASTPFTVGPDMPLLRLRLNYTRALGTTRIAGTLTVPTAQIHAQT